MFVMDENLTLLSRVPLFSSLPPEELENLSSSLTLMKVTPGEVLFCEYDLGDFFYIIREGQVEVVKAMGTPEERSVGMRGPGEFVGEMSLLSSNGMRTASVRAVGHGSLWEMKRDDFNALLHRHPMLGYEMVRVLSYRLTTSHNRAISDLQEKNEKLRQAYEELKAAQEQLIEKERMERELQVAHQIQMSILPQSLPQLDGYDFGVKMIPARMVGGDFYDFIPLSDDKVGVIVGDVTDKGVPAAIFMAQVHALLRAEACRGCPPNEVLQTANNLLLDMNERGLFVTVLYGVLDRSVAEFSYARAGHELPIVANKLGGSKFISSLWLYTDGLTDEHNPQGVRFGGEMLLSAISDIEGETAQDTCDQMIDRIKAYRKGAPLEDDVTLVVVSSKIS
jgi:serine phosphatase RsbU (regulator of sigma subunit)